MRIIFNLMNELLVIKEFKTISRRLNIFILQKIQRSLNVFHRSLEKNVNIQLVRYYFFKLISSKTFLHFVETLS